MIKTSNKRPVGFMYAAVLSVITVLMILVYALDYQSRSSKAVSRMAESRLYTDIAVSEHVGKTLTSVELQYRSGVDWSSADIPIEMDPEQHTHDPGWSDVREIEDWTADKFPRIGTYPPHDETASSFEQEITSPGQEDDYVAFPTQTRGLLEPDSNDVGFKAPASHYRMSLVKGFPFAAYAPQGEVVIQGTGVAWSNPTDAELDEEKRTLDYYTGLPFRVGARGLIEVEDLPYGEAYSLEEPPQIKGGGISYRGVLPYSGTSEGYAIKLKERLAGTGSYMGGLTTVLNANSYDKTDNVFGTLNVVNIIMAIFDPDNASFNNFLTYEQSTRWWFVLIPGFKSRGPALDITLHAPLKPDFGTYDSDDPVYDDEDDIEMTPELEEATDKLAEIEVKLGKALLSKKLSGDKPGTQPLSVNEAGGKKSPDFQKFTEIVNDYETAESKYEQAEDERDKKTGKDEDKAADRRHEENAKKLEREAKDLTKKHGFNSLNEIEDWMGRKRRGSYEIEDKFGVKKTENFNQSYKKLLKEWQNAEKDFAEAKNDAAGLNDGSPAVDEYDPGPTRAREKELVRKKDLDMKGWKGTNLWTMVAKIAVVIANLMKDIGTAFYNHVFVEVKIFGVTIPLPNPVKIVTFFFADGEFQDQDIQGQNYSFKKDGVPDLVELALVTLKRALVQEVTLVYLGKDDGIGPSVPVRIGPDAGAGMQKGEPEGEMDTFSIHNTFTVPAGRTFKLLPKDGMSGMTIGADLWLQRGSTLYVSGDLIMENPEPSLSTPHKPKGKIVMEPGSTIVVDGNFTAAGDPFMGSILLTRRPGRVEPITSAIICSGAVEIPHGTRSGLNLMQLAELIDDDVAEVMQDFFDDVVPNVSKVLGPFHGRKPHFAKHGATFTFYFPVIVPNPASSMLTKNVNVKLFALLSPIFSGSLNMTLGENFQTASDWWMFGEDRVPVLPKVVPGAVKAAFGEAKEQSSSMFSTSKASLDKMSDEGFFLNRGKEIVEGELKSMFDKADNLANNMDDFIADTAEDTLTEYFTVENITLKVIEFFGKAAAATLDPTGIAMIAFEELESQFLPESGGSFLTTMIDSAQKRLEDDYGFPMNGKDYLEDVAKDVLEPFKDMADELRNGVDGVEKRALRVATTLMAAETPGVLIYGDSVQVEGLYAAGLFVANNDLTMDCAYTIGSMVSVEGNISAKEVLFVPEFTRAAIYQPPETVETPDGSGIGRLPEYWADSLGLDFGEGKIGSALNYGSGTGKGTWHEVPDPNYNTAFRAAGGWGP